MRGEEVGCFGGQPSMLESVFLEWEGRRFVLLPCLNPQLAGLGEIALNVWASSIISLRVFIMQPGPRPSIVATLIISILQMRTLRLERKSNLCKITKHRKLFDSGREPKLV